MPASDGVDLGPQPVDVGAGLLAGDPPAGAVGGGDSAVEGGGVLPGHERAAGATAVSHALVAAARGLGPSTPDSTRRRRRAARSAPPPAPRGRVGARRTTTRAMPASISASVHGPVRPVWRTARGSRRRCRRGPVAAPGGRRPRRAVRPADACQPSPTTSPGGVEHDRADERVGAGACRAGAAAARRRAASRRPRCGWPRSSSVVSGCRTARLRGRRAPRAAHGDPRTARALPPIRTLTVGPGVPPGQPPTGCGRVADCHRRFGIAPTPGRAVTVGASLPHARPAGPCQRAVGRSHQDRAVGALGGARSASTAAAGSSAP